MFCAVAGVACQSSVRALANPCARARTRLGIFRTSATRNIARPSWPVETGSWLPSGYPQLPTTYTTCCSADECWTNSKHNTEHAKQPRPSPESTNSVVKVGVSPPLMLTLACLSMHAGLPQPTLNSDAQGRAQRQTRQPATLRTGTPPDCRNPTASKQRLAGQSASPGTARNCTAAAWGVRPRLASRGTLISCSRPRFIPLPKPYIFMRLEKGAAGRISTQDNRE